MTLPSARAQARPHSQQIGRDLEDRVEALLRGWAIPYHRGRSISTSFGSRFTVDFWLESHFGRPPVIIEAKNFGVAAIRTADSRGRKAQEALYLLVHIRRHCIEARGVRIVLVSGKERFATEQIAFLTAELKPDFHVVSVDEPEALRALVLPNQGPEPGLTMLRDA